MSVNCIYLTLACISISVLSRIIRPLPGRFKLFDAGCRDIAVIEKSLLSAAVSHRAAVSDVRT